MAGTDEIHRFHLPEASVRGHLVRLEAVWSAVRENMDCPPVVGALLGEGLAAAALLAGALKFDGRLYIQLRNAGALNLLFAESSSDGSIRGLARCADNSSSPFSGLGGHRGEIVITVENTASSTRYQGIVPIRSERLSAVLEDYFTQSEQLSTRMLLASDGNRCAGLMLQRIANDPGDATAGSGDAWEYIGHVLATVSEYELLGLSVEEFLTRLFHEQDVQLEAGRSLRFHCTCSRARVEEMLRGLGRDEAMASARESGSTTITCEFCNRSYWFDVEAIAGLFAPLPGSNDGVAQA